MEPRHEKGILIASSGQILPKKNGLYIVPSQTHAGSYVVEFSELPSCTCPDHELNHNRCKHIIAVEIVRCEESPSEKKLKITYSQNWTAYNKAQQSEKERVQHFLRALCDGLQNPPQGRGRPRLPLSDVVFSSVMKVYTTVSGRRAATDIRNAKEAGLIDASPHYNSISRYLENPELTPILEGLVTESALPLSGLETQFAIDSTGFSTSTYARWFDQKWGKEKKFNVYRKAHIICGTKTHVVTKAKIDDGNDCPQFPALLEGTVSQFDVKEISADKAYLSKDNFNCAVSNGAIPFIPFKTNSVEGSGLWSKLWHFFQFNRDEFLVHYHRRSNVETTFSMIKAKFGSSIRSKSPTAQENEILCKIIAHNLCVLTQATFEFGIEPEFWKNVG